MYRFYWPTLYMPTFVLSTLPCILFCNAFMISDCITLMRFVDVVDTEMETVLGEMEVELDGRFSTVRNTETNLGISCCLFMMYIYKKSAGVLQQLAIHTSYRFMHQTHFTCDSVLGMPPKARIGYRSIIHTPEVFSYSMY